MASHTAYLINGPMHGTRTMLHHGADGTYRIAGLRGAVYPLPEGRIEPALSVGVYVRTNQLRLDPFTGLPSPDPVGWIYEWKGWE